jgi:hypothetical protein
LEIGAYLKFGIWDLEFETRLGVGEDVQIGTDLSKGIGQQKNPDAYQKKTAHNRNRPHIFFHSAKGGEKIIKGKRGKKEWNSQTHGINREENDPSSEIPGGAGIDEDGRKDRANTRGPSCCKNNPDEKRAQIAQGFLPHLEPSLHL